MAEITRTELKRLALEKKADADLLHKHGRYGNAYYLYGYAVELALKAVIAKQFRADTVPDKRLATKMFVHDFLGLVQLATLENDLRKSRAASPAFKLCWDTVVSWSPESRYESRTAAECEDMKTVLEDPTDGVMQWISGHW
jgi:hypothetical protein